MSEPSLQAVFLESFLGCSSKSNLLSFLHFYLTDSVLAPVTVLSCECVIAQNYA